MTEKFRLDDGLGSRGGLWEGEQLRGLALIHRFELAVFANVTCLSKVVSEDFSSRLDQGNGEVGRPRRGYKPIIRPLGAWRRGGGTLVTGDIDVSGLLVL